MSTYLFSKTQLVNHCLPLGALIPKFSSFDPRITAQHFPGLGSEYLTNIRLVGFNAVRFASSNVLCEFDLLHLKRPTLYDLLVLTTISSPVLTSLLRNHNCVALTQPWHDPSGDSTVPVLRPNTGRRPVLTLFPIDSVWHNAIFVGIGVRIHTR